MPFPSIPHWHSPVSSSEGSHCPLKASKTTPTKEALLTPTVGGQDPRVCSWSATAPAPAMASRCHVVPLLNAGRGESGFFQEGHSQMIPLLKRYTLWPLLLIGFLADRPHCPVLWGFYTVLFPTSEDLCQESSGLRYCWAHRPFLFPVLGTHSTCFSFQPPKH